MRYLSRWPERAFLRPRARVAPVTPLAPVRQKEEHSPESQAVADRELDMVVSEQVSGRLGTEGSDAELVRAALTNPSSFLALYERYFLKVQRYVRIRISDRAACEDVTSEVFMAALAGLPNFRGSGSFAAWLFRIAQNAVRSHHRGNRTVSLDEATLAVVPDEDTSPPEEALRRERLLELRALVSALKPEQQDLLALRYGAELESHEIGQVLGKSAVAVRVALHRTVAELRRRYFDDE
jgi:RNA polymerase sigma-70 factor (ECF subfamily)